MSKTAGGAAYPPPRLLTVPALPRLFSSQTGPGRLHALSLPGKEALYKGVGDLLKSIHSTSFHPLVAAYHAVFYPLVSLDHMLRDPLVCLNQP